MKTTAILLRAVIIAGLSAFCCSMGNAQISYSNSLAGASLIYSNAFNGGAVNISNTPPNFAASGLGGTNTALWIDAGGAGDTNAFYANGVVGTGQGDSILLPFKPQAGYVYTMTATVTFSGNPGNWVGAGFAQNYAVPGIGNARYSDSGVNGYDWSIVTESTGNVQFFAGPHGTVQLISQNGFFTAGSGTHTVTQILDTTGTKWVIACYVDGVQAATNYPYSSNPSIAAVGLTQNSLSAPGNIRWNSLTLSAAPIVIGQQPVSAGVAVGSAFTNTVVAAGSAPLSYQWYANNVAIGNATNSALIINPVSTSNASTNYYVVITNNLGTATSSVANLTVYTLPTFAGQFPVTYNGGFTLYSGASPKFSVSIIGLQPHYQWFTNGVACGGGTNAAFTWPNVQAGTISAYCIVTNVEGSAKSMVWTGQVIADPANSSGGLAPYPTTTLAFNPVGYWRLNEGPDDGNGDQGVIALDYAGGNDGIYTNGYLDNLGYSPSTDPSDSSPLFSAFASPNSDVYGIQGIDFSAPASTSATFSIEAWVNGSGAQNASGAGIATKGYGGAEQFDLDVFSGSYRFLMRDAAGNSYGPTSAYTSDGNWHYLAGVCDEVNGTVSLYVDGKLMASVPIAAGSGVFSSSRLMTIGARSSTSLTGNDLQFEGYINDVTAFNYALSAAQVLQQYASVISVPPFFAQTPPASATANAGGSLTLPATILGSSPVGYYWYDVSGGTNVAAAVTNGLPLNATLTITNVPGSWNNDQLELTVTNAAGTSSVYVSLTVYTNKPLITSDLPASLSLLSGVSYTYAIAVDGPAPYAYQWYNMGVPLAGSTNATYTATAGNPGSSTTYYVVITNVYGAVTSVVSTLESVAQPTNAYASGVLSLNPAGYWPMHEVEAAAPGDIETNYGTLGALGTAYYPDWAANAGAFIRQVSGALAGDPDPALHFSWNIGTTGQTWTNELYVPHTSPRATLNPPFSVECWVYNTNTTIGGAALNQSIWGQHGWEGLNAGNAGNGNGNIDGMQLAYSSGGGVSIYVYDNNSGGVIIASATAAINAWEHMVVTCDANTNFTLYVNGVAGTITNATGKYSPDYWTPLTIGGTRGGTRSALVTVDEFAIYTNVISDVAAHYNDGISGGAGVYFNAVKNDNPVVYLRMDAPAYAAPAMGSWPELNNYGSVANPGNYTPGTMPGIVSGPTSNGTNYLGLSGTNVAALSGVSSFADAGYAPAYNPTGSNASFTVSAMFRGNPCDNRVQSIVSHGLNSWELNVTTNGTLVFNAGNGNAPSEGTGQNPGDVSTAGVYNDGKWHQVTAVNATNVVSIYVDGSLVTSGTPGGITPTSVIHGNSNDVMIGADPSNTNTPVGVGRQFAGQVCEVAFFNQALTSSQVHSNYNLALNGFPVVIPVINANPTNIVFTVAGNQLTLGWPADHTGWTLQAQTNNLSAGLTTNWVNVTGSTLTNQITVPANPGNGSVFYRLFYQP
jgi:hypothetical protein